jgi:hypothetical protein
MKPKMPHEYIPGAPRPGQHMGKHPGFKKVQQHIASQMGVSEERAGAILAARTRMASPAAKRANPRLKRVRG